MTPADIQSLVRSEIDRMFAGDDHVTFAGDPKHTRTPPGFFYDRFLEVMSGIHRTLTDLAQRVATVEHRLHDLEQVMRHKGHKPDGDGHAHEGARSLGHEGNGANGDGEGFQRR